MIAIKRVVLPHLRATVHFFDMTSLVMDDRKGPAFTMYMTRPKSKHIDVSIFYEELVKSTEDLKCMPMIMHEIIHGLQYICENRGIDMAEEKEHIAYMSSYLIEQLMDIDTGEADDYSMMLDNKVNELPIKNNKKK
jgi:hypothetical protein